MRSFIGAWVLLATVTGVAAAQDDTPRRRWEYFNRQRAYPFQNIPAGALRAARTQALSTWPRLSASAGRAAAPWVAVGPQTISPFAFPEPFTSAGRLTAIAVHPSDGNILYIGGAQGGVWKSTDGGSSWTALTDTECSLAMGSIAIDPVNPQIVYAGTGEQHFSGDSYYGCGLLRSDDGGATWTRLGASVFTQAGGAGATISRVVIDPSTAGSSTSTTVHVASDFGLFYSTNSGATWSQSLTGGAWSDLLVDPTAPGVLYAAAVGNGVFKSTDNGMAWTALAGGFPTTSLFRINLAVAPSSPTTLYAAVVDGDDEEELLGLYRTDDAGATWTQTAETPPCGQCFYDLALAVDPTDPNTLYFGGVDLYKTIDGGDTFTALSTFPNEIIHVDQHHFAFDPQNPGILFVGNDGGIYSTTDGGINWTTLNANLAITQFYAGVSPHPTDPNVIIGGTQDNGTVRTTGATTWLQVLGGDGGYTAIDFENPDVMYAQSQWVPDDGFNGPNRSDDGGDSFVRKVSGINTSERGEFIAPLIMDRTDPATLYFGTFRLYRTRDRGETWTAISGDLTNGPPSGISAIAPAPSNPAVVYVGTADGNVHVTLDDGATFDLITAGVPDRFVTDLAVDPTDFQTAYVTVSGFGSGHVFRTTNAGGNWQDISANLPDLPVNTILLEPGTPSTIYIGTDLGVYASTNSGGTWSPFNDGLPLVAVFDLAAVENTGVLTAATHGRSLFTTTFNVPLSLTVDPTSRSATVDEGSTDLVSDSAAVRIGGTGASNTVWTATHGAASWLNLTAANGTGNDQVRWTRDPTGLAPGVYVDTITVSAAVASGSPALVIDSLTVSALLTMAVTPGSRSTSVVEGSTAPVPDSADVTLAGPGAEMQGWVAAHGGGTWLTLTTSNGTGSGVVRWTRDPSGLGAGTYVDTITVTSSGAGGSPARVIDSMVVEAALAMAVSPASRLARTVAGFTRSTEDSATVSLTGAGAGMASWSATHGEGTWLSLTTATGTGAGYVRWSRDASTLDPGTYVDTITVTAPSAAGSPAFVFDTLIAGPPIALDGAAEHLLVGGTLTTIEESFLDAQGNQDGTFNLGDVLAWLDYCTGSSPGGCVANTGSIARVRELVGQPAVSGEATGSVPAEPGARMRRQR